MNKLLLIAMIAVTGATVAETTKLSPEEYATRLKKVKALYAADIERKTGGRIVKPHSGFGTFLFINATKYLSRDVIDQCVVDLRQGLKVTILQVEDANMQLSNVADTIKRYGGDLGVGFVEDAGLNTTLLLAPEQGWCVVNMMALKADGADEQTIAKRTRKEFLRGFAMVASGAASQYPKSLYGPFKNLKNLDESDENAYLPPDIGQTISAVMPQLGVKPFFECCYIDACREGWAPAPTNDIQKAIWDKVHASPTKPIKITYDKARQKPVVE